MDKPIIGKKILVPSSYYVYRGEDDFKGGVATIDSIKYDKNLPEDHINHIMVGIKERPNTMYNYKVLMEKQDELFEQFGQAVAHPDPDMREEFNDPEGDWKVIYP